MDDKKLIIEYLKKNPNSSSKEIFEGVGRQKKISDFERNSNSLIELMVKYEI